MISVVIPAHNEAAVIGQTLEGLTRDAQPGELEIIVVCNACTDQTAQIAGEFGGCVRVVETDIPSKVNAVNLGDAAATSFPRIYLDADVRLRFQVALRIAETLRENEVLAAAPLASFDLAGCSWAVRAFYDINARLPSSREGIGGSGVYAVSEMGRKRFARFPDLTADDGFVRIHFAAHERVTLQDCESIVSAPRNLRSLLAIKTRSHFGSYELQQRYPELWCNRGAGNSSALRRLVLKPLLWPKLFVYGYVKMLARLRAQRRIRSGRDKMWDRDDTSRTPLPVA